MPEQQPSGLESQIQQLERELAQKRAELGGDAGAPYERSEVHLAVGEQIRQAVPGYQSQSSDQTAGGSVVQDPAFTATVQQLVNVAFTQSIQEAIGQALKTGNPALVDALHDILADQFHQELLNRKKLEPAP
jgi:hypothetical protein